jgi:HD-GYP domain-containing protein (c-di-GMP phosphodiesterase class II)
LLIKRIAVDTTKLAKGMYVVMLDRPWLETPFVFQGFEIKNRFEIEQLQSYCHYVYVDIDRGTLTDAQIRNLIKASPSTPFVSEAKIRTERDKGWLSRFRAHVVRLDSTGFLAANLRGESSGYKISSTVRREAPRATAAYEFSLEAYRSIYDSARRGMIQPETVKKAVKPMIESVLRNPDAMAWTIFSKKRNPRNYNRAIATSVWAVMFGRQLGFDRNGLRDLAIGGLLLDIGNSRLPDDIVHLEGAITEEQYQQMSRHVRIGAEIVETSQGFSKNVREMVRSHHERADGSGYPDGLIGLNIPIYGRIAGIADSYDAMTTKTAYSPAMAAYESARELNDMRGKEFQTEVVGQFLRTIGMFPTGSIVELSDGTVGMVLEQNRVQSLRPKLMILLDTSHNMLGQPKILDMRKLPEKASSARAVWIVKGHEHGAFGIDPLNYFT